MRVIQYTWNTIHDEYVMDGPSAIWATRIHWLKHEITLHYDTLADTSNLFLL